MALTANDDSIQLYFAEDSTNTLRSRNDLVTRLFDFCNLQDATEFGEHPKFLLQNILEAQSSDEINDVLSQAGVPALPSDSELDNENERQARLHADEARKRWDSHQERVMSLIDQLLSLGVQVLGMNGKLHGFAEIDQEQSNSSYTMPNLTGISVFAATRQGWRGPPVYDDDKYAIKGETCVS